MEKHWSYLSLASLTPYPEIKFKPSSTKEIENIIASLKQNKKTLAGMMKFRIIF
jgi:hypothetical protein